MPQKPESRCSGILLHFTSLPSKFGVGDFGPAAFEFVDSLEQAGQTLNDNPASAFTNAA